MSGQSNSQLLIDTVAPLAAIGSVSLNFLCCVVYSLSLTIKKRIRTEFKIYCIIILLFTLFIKIISKSSQI